ncbi:MAG: methyltransferase domain-containing protein [Lentisphaeria bacterium]|nr:methyltransferase domain-containing protein [Lentisphaeria bacterium]
MKTTRKITAKRPEKKTPRTFADEPKKDFLRPAPALHYADYLENGACDLTAKQVALERFWAAQRLPGKVPAIVQSPREEHYRTTSKRKAVWKRGRLEFSMGYSLKYEAGETVSSGSKMEAELHEELYAKTLDLLRREHYQPLAKALNFCIIRGSYEKAAVVLNLFSLSGVIGRKLKMYAEEMAKDPRVSGVFLYFDESRSEYYFEAQRPRVPLNFKKLYGSSMLALELPDRPKLLYPPTVFSQVNESILDRFTSTALTLLKLTDSKRLIDLYCGYGLFALYGAASAGSVIGIDMEGPAIQAAKANAAHLYPEKNIRFEALSITSESLFDALPPPDGNEVILLDPPRSGTADGVISAVTARKPERILAIYCGTDQMAFECKLWTANGYKLEHAVSFDMFPGSPNLETMLLFKRISGR